MRKIAVFFLFGILFAVLTASAEGAPKCRKSGTIDYFFQLHISTKGCSFLKQSPELMPLKMQPLPPRVQKKHPRIQPHNFEANYNRWIKIQNIYRPKRSLYQELIRNRRSLNLA
ncbi:hypothetical protein KAH55_10255 [bacterium]|nr:hypothetical protein [bacterium]